MGGRRAGRRWALLLLELPEILLAGVILWMLHQWAGLSLGWALGLCGLRLLKELAMLFLLRDVFAPSRVGPETLEGARAVVTEPLVPRGHVRIGAELWRAECMHPQEEIVSGTPVVVRGTRGLTLLVEHEGTAERPD